MHRAPKPLTAMTKSPGKASQETPAFKHLHNRFLSLAPEDDCAHFSRHHRTINSLTTNRVPKIVLLWLASQLGR